MRDLPKHMPALDGLRGVAVLMVLLTHVGDGWRRALMVTQDADWMDPLQVAPWFRMICDRAGSGVQLFFVISAFTLTIRAAQGDSIGSYALRRIARVGPGYWLAGLAYTSVAGFGPRLLAPQGTEYTDIAIAAVFGSAWLGGASLAVVPGGWSVCCEVAFYVALPIALWTINGRISRAVMLTGAGVVVAQLWERSGTVLGAFSPVEQIPVFLCGITAATIAKQKRIPHLPGVALTLLTCAILILPFSPIHHWYLIPQVPFGMVAAVVVALSAVRPPPILAHPALRRIGEVSYSIYLVHFALLSSGLYVADWLAPGYDWRTLALYFVLTGAASFGVACLTYRWIEQPAIRWAARQLRRTQVTAVAAE